MHAVHKYAATAGQAAPAPDEKTFASVAAKFALRGHALNRTLRADDGSIAFTVCRWNQSRAFRNWDHVVEFLAMLGRTQ